MRFIVRLVCPLEKYYQLHEIALNVDVIGAKIVDLHLNY